MQQQSEKNQKVYRFSVDGKEYESTQQLITGAQLREIARVNPHLRIFAGDHKNHKPDSIIHNTASVDLADPKLTNFYTLSAPTLDIY